MLLTVQEFKQRVRTGLYALTQDLAKQTGRGGADERQSWFNSLPRLAALLDGPELAPAHLFFSGGGNSSLEYRIPGTGSTADVILLGSIDDRSSVVVLELKHWSTAKDRPGPTEGLIDRHDGLYHHPSDQVAGYVEFVKRSHSAVDARTSVVGAALFTATDGIDAYRKPPNKKLASEYPCFAIGRGTGEFLDAQHFLTKNIKAPDAKFAKRFENGEFRQNARSILSAAQSILKSRADGLVLLDHQRYALAHCMALLQGAFAVHSKPRKITMVVKGPPGSGKSVVALKLWAEAVAKFGRVQGSKHFVTTSASQAENWERTIDELHGNADWLARRSSSFQPLSGSAYGRCLTQVGIKSGGRRGWKETLRALEEGGIQYPAERRDNCCALTVVDEAHALMNPEHREVDPFSGIHVDLGPVGYHIIRCSRVSVFFLDPEQGFRDKENTSIEDLKTWSRELKSEFIEVADLSGAQFRCAGSVEYVAWVDALLANAPVSHLAELGKRWHTREPDMSRYKLRDAAAEVTGRGLDFRIFSDPLTMENALRMRRTEGQDVRLLATFAREWRSSKITALRQIKEEHYDFNIPLPPGQGAARWRKLWNLKEGGFGYTAFIQAPTGSAMHSDPLGQIGCPYVVRGFDYGYVGILWFSDLRAKGGRLAPDLQHIHETSLRSTKAAARRGDGEAKEALAASVNQAYRILLTRGLKGIYLWFEDDATRRHVEAALGD